MGFQLTLPAPEKGDPTAKDRVWRFFESNSAGSTAVSVSFTMANDGHQVLDFAYDGNGNIIAWSDLSGQSSTPIQIQKREYDPFGNTISKIGSIPAGDMPHGFSTKYEDGERFGGWGGVLKN